MFMKKMKFNRFLQLYFAIISLLILSLIGCGGGGGGGSSSAPIAQPTPDIAVSTTQMAFGDIVVDRSSSDATITVQNTGPAFLNIGQIIPISSGPFSILNDTCSGKPFWQGETCTFQIRFSPSAEGAVNGAFNIPSNDPDENPVALNVSGYGRSLYVSINERTCIPPTGVRLLVNVTDKDANPLPNLLPTHLTLTENGLLRNIGNFDHLGELISVAVALDHSGSMVTIIPEMKAAAKIFIERLDPPNGGEASIIKFSNYYELKQDFTTDKNSLLAAIDGDNFILDPAAETALYHTLLYAIDETANKGSNSRKAVVVISDGKDTFSQETIDDVIASAQAKSVRLFTIGLGLEADVGVLQRLANETGGNHFIAPTAGDLSLFYRQIADALVGQYALEFTSQVSGGGSMALDLVVDLKDGRTGRATASLAGCP